MAHSVITFPDQTEGDDCPDGSLIDAAAQALLTALAEQPVPTEIQNLMQALGQAIDARRQGAIDFPETP